MQIKTILFDLDDTLYPKSSGLMAAVAQRMTAEMGRITGLPPAEVDLLRQKYVEQFGTTLAGLAREYDVDTEAFLADAHNVDHYDHIGPDSELDNVLHRLPQRKVVFTNGTWEHAEAVLDVLGVRHHFDLILGLRAYGMQPKPNQAAYDTVLAHLDHAPDSAMFLDDRPVNLTPASQLGIKTVLVNELGEPHHNNHDFEIRTVHEIEEIVRGLL